MDTPDLTPHPSSLRQDQDAMLPAAYLRYAARADGWERGEFGVIARRARQSLRNSVILVPKWDMRSAAAKIRLSGITACVKRGETSRFRRQRPASYD